VGLTSFTEQGDPADWTEPGPVQNWLREKLREANIPLHAVACLHASRKNLSESVDFLLDHRPCPRKKSRLADEQGGLCRSIRRVGVKRMSSIEAAVESKFEYLGCFSEKTSNRSAVALARVL